MAPECKKAVVLCEIQPVAAEGLSALLGTARGLELAARASSLAAGTEIVRRRAPAVLVLDKGFGTQAVLGCLEELRRQGGATASVVWGASMTAAEALRFIQAGARGVIRKSADLDELLTCMEAVAAGASWVERNLLPSPGVRRTREEPAMTARERQVADLVAQGLKNREIALELGIRPGTVKVHLKHIFEKTGIRGRYGLALAGWSKTAPACRQAQGTAA